VAEYDRAFELAASAQAWVAAQVALSNSATTSVALGRLQEALARHERATALPLDAAADSLFSAIDQVNRAGMLIELGRLGEALALLDATAPALSARDAGHWRVLACGHQAYLWLLLGHPDRASRTVAETGQSLDDDPRPAWSLSLAALRLRLARAAGESTALLAERAASVRGLLVDRVLQPRQRLGIEIELALALEPGAALEALRRVEHDAEALQHRAYALAARVRCIPVLHRLGRGADAAALARATLDACEHVHPFDVYLPQLWRDAAEVLAEAGQIEPALAALGRAVRWIDAATAGLPPALRPAFLERNAVNRALRAQWSRVGGALR
jgi:tetratricopeptide (TPR) repeat protein